MKNIMKKYSALFLFLFPVLSYSQYWQKIDSVFSPFGVTVQSFSAPEFCDIDADGDFDLFVGTLGDDRVVFFRNTGSSTTPVYREDTSLVSSIYAGGYQYTNADYPALADLDNDNDYDLVIGGFNGILMYWNTGDSAAPIWSKDTVLMAGVDSVIGTDAKPAFADLDGDGDYDLIIGIGESFYGDVTPGITIAFRNNGTPADPSLSADNSFVAGIPDVGLNAYPYFRDMDNDGDLDMFMGRDLQTMLYYKNTGTAQSPVWTSTPSLVSPLETAQYWKNPAVCDLDGDGDNDLIYGTDDGTIFYYQNTGTPSAPVLTRNTSYFSMIKIDGGASTASLADYDNDGDLDLISGEQLGKFQYFRNDGTSSNPLFTKTTTSFTSIDAGSYSSPRFVDIDKDGDYDIVSGALDGMLYCYINTSGTFSQNTTIFSGIDVGWQSQPSFADLNNDGHLDLIVCGEVAAEAKFYKNNGSNGFVIDNTFLAGITIPSYSHPCFVDVDGDGDFDLVFGRSGGSLTFYENTGTASAPVWQLNSDVFPGVAVPQKAAPDFGDMDGDGMKDLIIGEYSGNFTFFKNLLPTSVADPEGMAPGLFSLTQNYPNPFNPLTSIRFSIPHSGSVSLRVYDIIGRNVATLIDEVMARGNHSVQWDASSMPSGVYFYTLQSGGRVQTKKLILLK
jgi:hypothetical protein